MTKPEHYLYLIAGVVLKKSLSSSEQIIEIKKILLRFYNEKALDNR